MTATPLLFVSFSNIQIHTLGTAVRPLLRLRTIGTSIKRSALMWCPQKSGTLCYDLDGEIGKLQAGETATILPGRYHTFWPDPDVKADLDVHITVSGGPNKGLDDVFLVNFYGYLSSVTMRGESPNPLQMFAFLDHADVVLADFPLQTGRLANIILGRWIGRGLAGYQVEYKEFSEDSE
ncbi:hypothetical protein WG66_001165 [Moniliophthora roreri]|nr:hypothetical protein WG66_001165 [Moniliophthora roreri]